MKIISFALFISISVMGCMKDAGTNPETPIELDPIFKPNGQKIKV
jgi:hypothetical protein